MYCPILLRASLIALTLGAIQTQADARYPAADFTPQVLYRAQAEASAAQGAEYPAAHFTPRVVFQDPELIEAVGPLPQPVVPVSPAQPELTAERASPSGQTGSISDAAPPYGALGLAVAVIALAFWWSTRQAKLEQKMPQAPGSNQESAPEASGQDLKASEEAEEALEELAAEVEETLATTNRQRAGKTKRTRRR